MSTKEIDKLLKESEYNPWVWCDITVTATYTTPSGVSHKEHSYLAACNYESKEDFIENSGYYEDMKKDCINELCKKLQG
jgi:hypothetical protein